MYKINFLNTSKNYCYFLFATLISNFKFMGIATLVQVLFLVRILEYFLFVKTMKLKYHSNGPYGRKLYIFKKVQLFRNIGMIALCNKFLEKSGLWLIVLDSIYRRSKYVVKNIYTHETSLLCVWQWYLHNCQLLHFLFVWYHIFNRKFSNII